MNFPSPGNYSCTAILALGLVLGSALLAPCLTAQTTPSPAPAPVPANKPPARVRTNVVNFEISPNAGKGPDQVMGGSRGFDLRQFAPGSGKAYSTTPYFHWGGADPGAKVTFRLSTVDGRTVYEVSTNADRLKYPADAPALTPGSSYQWTILPENDIFGGPPGAVKFLIVSGEERAQILKELVSASNASATATVFVNHSVWYDADQAYSEQIERMPKDKSARAARANFYDQLPATKKLAEADWSMVH